MRNKLVLIFIFLTFLPAFITFFQERSRYLKPVDLEFVKYIYPLSQYVKKGEEAAWIPDETLFTYAGWYYINGGNPTLVNPENPPLGKYFIGISLKLFNNPSAFNFVFGLGSLISLLLLTKYLFNNSIWGIIPIMLFSWGKLYREQLTNVPLFETIALTFLTLSIYFFIKGQNNYYFFFLSSLFLGLLWGIRPWMATAPLIIGFLIYLLFISRKLKNAIIWFTSLSLSVLVLLAVYSKLLFLGWSIYKVLSVQKWILWYHQSRLINVGTVWPFLYLNRWYIWWGNSGYTSVEQWSYLWPIFTTLSLLFILFIFISKFKKNSKLISGGGEIDILALWILFYLLFLSIGNINSRYIFYLIPYLYISGLYFIKITLKGLLEKKQISVKIH